MTRLFSNNGFWLRGAATSWSSSSPVIALYTLLWQTSAMFVAAQSMPISTPISRLRGTRRAFLTEVLQNTTSATSFGNINTSSNSESFQAIFGILLILIVLFRLVICGFLIKHRKQGNLQLAQPSVLTLITLAGSVSIASCFFLINPRSDWASEKTADTFCFLRDPMILTPLTLAGSCLLGRVWRIVLLLTPILQVQDEEEGSCGNCLMRNIMKFLTQLADSHREIQRFCMARCRIGNNGPMKRTRNTTIRKKVPVLLLLYLIFLLMIPQLVLQLCNLIVPHLQERVEIISNPLPEESSNYLQQWSCRALAGRWPTYVGIVFTVLPYLATAILAWHSMHDLPKIFDEGPAITSSAKVLALSSIIVVPPLLWQSGENNPDTSVYLTSVLVFALAMPPCWFIVYPKILQVLNDDSNERVAIRGLLNRKRSQRSGVGRPTLHINGNTSNDRYETNSKSAKLALTIGKLYEDMGLHSKSLTLFDDALAVWQVDPARDNKEQVGGFTRDEIDSFSVADLECIISLMIAKGRVNGTFNSGNDSGPKNAAKAWLDALEVYELAPARASMKDRSMLFPVFSGLLVFLKGGKIQDDAKGTFEQNLAKKFVRETKLQGDPVHYTRALAMLCEVKARLGKYKDSLASFNVLKEIYDPEEHSQPISEAYGTDRSAQAFSQCALWHMEMGNMHLALQACEYVLDDIMYLMDPKNVLNMCEMLLPIIRIYKPRGEEKRMRDLFQKYVIHNFEKYFAKQNKSSPCEPIFKPLRMLLDICHDPDNFSELEDAVEWLMQDENGVAPDFLDSVYTKLCWSPHTMTAELCLRVAKRLVAQHGHVSDTEALILKGLDLCHKSVKKIKSKDGTVRFPIANAMHQPVFDELKELASSLKIEYLSDLEGNSSVGLSSKGSKLDLKNLPNSYKVGQKSSDGGSGSNQSPLILAGRPSLVGFETRSRSVGTDGSTSVEDTAPATSSVTNNAGSYGLTSRVSELSLDSKLRSRVESCIEEEEEEEEPMNDTTQVVSHVRIAADFQMDKIVCAADNTTKTFGDDSESPVMF